MAQPLKWRWRTFAGWMSTLFDDPDDAADWFSHIKRLIEKARNDRELKLASVLLDGHHFLALPEPRQRELVNLYADKLLEMGAD